MLIGGADETEETGRVFSYMNLARAFAELDGGARALLPAPEPLVADHARAAARLGLLRRRARVRRRARGDGRSASRAPRTSRRRVEALDAEPELTWMVGDDIEADVAGAQRFGMRTALVRTGKFRPDELERTTVTPDVVLSSVADLPAGSRRRCEGRHRPDRDRAHPARRSSATRAFGTAASPPAEQAYCDSRPNPAQHYAARFAGKEAVGKALGFGVARRFAWRDIEIAGRPKPGVRLSGRVAAWSRARRSRAIDLSMTHSRELASGGLRRRRRRCDDSSRSTPRTRCGRGGGHDVERADGAGGTRRRRRDPRALSRTRGRSPRCAGAAPTAATAASRPSSCERPAGRNGSLGDADVVIDALFGTASAARRARRPRADPRR